MIYILKVYQILIPLGINTNNSIHFICTLYQKKDKIKICIAFSFSVYQSVTSENSMCSPILVKYWYIVRWHRLRMQTYISILPMKHMTLVSIIFLSLFLYLWKISSFRLSNLYRKHEAVHLGSREFPSSTKKDIDSHSGKP